MLPRLTSLLILLAPLTAWAQVAPGATGGTTTGGDSQMMTPPPVSGSAYPTTVGSDARANYLSAGVTVTGAYLDNVFPGGLATPLSDANFTILPSINIDHSTSRIRENLAYSPSFVLYEPTSSLDTVDQGASFDFQDRLTEGMSLNLQESFFRTSDVFDQSYTYSNGGVPGSTQTAEPAVIVPFAKQLSNAAHGVLSYQFGRDGMLGGGGSYAIFDFPNSVDSSGLLDSHQVGGVVFYNRRFSARQYFGLAYQYGRSIVGAAANSSDTQTHSLLPFYSHYFSPTFSLSVSGGLERVYVTETQVAASNSWSPVAVVSIGWQANRANIAATYTRSVTAEEGLTGAFNSSSINGSVSWKVARTWTGEVSGFYTTLSTITATSAAFAGWNTIAGQAILAHAIRDSLKIEFGYDRLHERYPTIPAISAAPNSDREFVNLSFQFTKPLGR
jgi:hypothetical protein